MSNTETGWTKFSDKLPEEGQLILYRKQNAEGWEGRATHWTSSVHEGLPYWDDKIWSALYTEQEVQARELAARREAFEYGFDGWDTHLTEQELLDLKEREFKAYLKTLEK